MPVDLSGVQRLCEAEEGAKEAVEARGAISLGVSRDAVHQRHAFSTSIRLSCLYLPPTAFVVSCDGSVVCCPERRVQIVRFRGLLGFGRARGSCLTAAGCCSR